jgi:hypothetical protein
MGPGSPEGEPAPTDAPGATGPPPASPARAPVEVSAVRSEAISSTNRIDRSDLVANVPTGPKERCDADDNRKVILGTNET